MGTVAKGTSCEGRRIVKARGGNCSPVGNLKCQGERGFFLCKEGTFDSYTMLGKRRVMRLLMHFWNRWLGEHGRRNRRDYLRRWRDRNRHVWRLMAMEILKTYGLVSAL